MLFSAVQFSVWGQSNSKGSLLEYNWVVLDGSSMTYVPYLPEKHYRVKSIYYWLSPEQYKDLTLGFTAAPSLSLFVNGELFYTNTTDSSEHKEFDGQFAGKKEGPVLISFFHPVGQFPMNFRISFPSELGENKQNILQIERRQSNVGGDYIIILFVLCIFLTGVFKSRYSKQFNEAISLSDSTLGQDNLSFVNVPLLLMVVINSFGFSIISMVVFDLESISYESLSFLLPAGKPLTRLIFLTLIFFSFFLWKYIYVIIAGWVFKMSKIVNIQYYSFLSTFLKINLVCVPMLVAGYSVNYLNPILGGVFFALIVLIGMIFLLVKLTFSIFTISSFRNLYLFSYLCVSEILPIFIISKLMLFDVS
ncbi:MAG: DUF4271 domain-containing protein [Cytophagaceae bacterium]